MGFFGALGKILAGKPIYDTTAPAPAGAASPQQPTGPVAVPVVRITRIESPVVGGGQMEINFDLHNESATTVFVDKVRLLGTARELDTDLAPGQVRELPVYHGTPPQTEANHYAEVQYRSPSGRYYIAQHEIRYHREADGVLHLAECHLIMPIRELH